MDPVKDEEFGALIIHDGKGAPASGLIVQAFYKFPLQSQIKGARIQGLNWVIGTIGKGKASGSWTWAKGFNPIVSYRIKKGQGYKILEELANDPPDELIKDPERKLLEYHPS